PPSTGVPPLVFDILVDRREVVAKAIPLFSMVLPAYSFNGTRIAVPPLAPTILIVARAFLHCFRFSPSYCTLTS
ncbi:MAG: hypothetical protein JRN20_12785, partial [Nitrososphaerota archaeon]|nr:hypothetical protein [Nitrososphaerota archaeon]